MQSSRKFQNLIFYGKSPDLTLNNIPTSQLKAMGEFKKKIYLEARAIFVGNTTQFS
jgi:hypothetical protein